ncbi:MAG: hypothetical protein Fur0010_24890 [Bdellovibrio sp.]
MNQRNPTENKSEAIGEYSLGCLEGAKTFEGNEKGILISQVRRGRYWGHPELIRVLTEAGLHFDRIGKKIILGDLSLSRGGPTLTGHNSHQTGLDVDIWFEMPNKNEKRNFRTIETLDMAPIGELKKDQIDLIRYFTSRNEVERIFINPRMKKAICNHPQKHKLTTEELRKLRAWFGHDDHIHVRLFCPKDSPECISQKPVPEGDGCDQLDWWFSDEAQKDTPVYNSENQKTVYLDKIKNLPVRCEFYFKQD